MSCKRGSVLVGLLWCLALLAVAVVGVLHHSRLDLKITKNQSDRIQAYYLALAGIEKAKAVIFHDSAERKRGARNHSSAIYDSEENFRDVPLGRGQYRVIRQDAPEKGGRLAYGVSDEQSRLNINTAPLNELARLPDLPGEVAAALVDWRDRDNNPQPGGAEAEYYSSLRPPYLPRDGRIQTARELVLVRGIDPARLLGEDENSNGLLDPEEDDGDASQPADNGDGILDAGWSRLIAFESRVMNKNAAGQDRVNVQTADESALTGIPGITPEIARGISAYRGQNQLESIADLLEVQSMAPAPGGAPPPPNPSGPGNRGRGGGPPQPAGAPALQPTGQRLISEDLFLQIADDVTASQDTALEGVININTAPPAVLFCLPGMTEEIARAIVAQRESAGFFPNIAHLLRVPGMTRDLFKQIAPRITARSETFRILGEGVVPSSGARQRVEVIVQLGRSTIDVVSYRENL